jgi:hypothetical protein
MVIGYWMNADGSIDQTASHVTKHAEQLNAAIAAEANRFLTSWTKMRRKQTKPSNIVASHPKTTIHSRGLSRQACGFSICCECMTAASSNTPIHAAVKYSKSPKWTPHGTCSD